MNKKYAEIKDEKQKKVNDALQELGVFWAFSDKQFEEGRPADRGIRLVSIGMGGFMPKDNFERFEPMMDAIDAWEREELKKVKAEEVILYELNNHESFYTGDIDAAAEVLVPMGYTIEQIRKVYHTNRPFAIN